MINLENGKRFCVVEINPDDKIIRMDYIYVLCVVRFLSLTFRVCSTYLTCRVSYMC